MCPQTAQCFRGAPSASGDSRSPRSGGMWLPASCPRAIGAMRWPWQGEPLFSVEKKLFGAKRGFKPLYERIKSLCPGFHSPCLRLLFFFFFLAWLFLPSLWAVFRVSRRQPSPAAGCPRGGAGHSPGAWHGRWGGRELPSLGRAMRRPAPCSPPSRPGSRACAFPRLSY